MSDLEFTQGDKVFRWCGYTGELVIYFVERATDKMLFLERAGGRTGYRLNKQHLDEREWDNSVWTTDKDALRYAMKLTKEKRDADRKAWDERFGSSLLTFEANFK